ncbi:MAG: RNA-directed DNA polymerase [Thiomicrospira sp.]
MDDSRLQFTPENFSNPTLLTLAWKKTHQYIRSTNWYADNFELDKSSVNLSKLCLQWGNDIKQEQLYFRDLELIPAPKSQKWEFIQKTNSSGDYCVEWVPQTKEAFSEDELSESEHPVKLRPIAHIGIKEQTIMTLIMMFLANEVESRQGDPSTDYEHVHEKHVVSYGNRIYCTYQNDQAEHNYGATHTYSKFFKDYQTFLQRPYHFANKELSEKGSDEEIYLVELDLKQFFDNVNRSKLVTKIRSIIKDIEGAPSNNRPLNHILHLFSNWKWSNESIPNFELCNHPRPPKGIPQGLVAGGFLANIYLLDFDHFLSNKIGEVIGSEVGIRLLDYCRYVDDMRLVLAGPARGLNSPKPIEEVKNSLNEFFSNSLQGLGLSINNDKTKVEIYRGKSVGISKQLQDIQTKASGPVSFEDAHEQLTQLESLLSVCSENIPDQNNQKCTPNRLASIERSVFDVRDDTLRRFATNKISRMLSSIRHFTARKVDESNNPVAGEWDYLQERMARRLIAVWSKDPSLVLLLKKGLELFPSPKLLEPVLEQFDDVLNRNSVSKDNTLSLEARKERAVIQYLLSEVFRHSAEIIHKKDFQSIPAQADISSYFELLQNYAIEVLNDKDLKGHPGLLIDQARFLLLVRLDTTLEKSTGNIQQDFIFKLAKGFRKMFLTKNKKRILDEQSIATCILLASQLIWDHTPLIRSVNSLFLQKSINALKILEILAIQDVQLVRQLINSARRLKLTWLDNNDIKTLIQNLYLDIRPSTKKLSDINKPLGILQLISREDNPFANEVMALKLMLALLEKSKCIEYDPAHMIDLAKTQIKFNGYSNPPKFEDFDKTLEIIGDILTIPKVKSV